MTRKVKLIVGGRGAGKTQRLVEELLKDPAHNLLVCASETEKRRLETRYPELWGCVVVAARGGAPTQDKHWVGLDNWLLMEKPMEVLNAWWFHSDLLTVTTDIPFDVEYLEDVAQAWMKEKP